MSNPNHDPKNGEFTFALGGAAHAAAKTTGDPTTDRAIGSRGVIYKKGDVIVDTTGGRNIEYEVIRSTPSGEFVHVKENGSPVRIVNHAGIKRK